MDVITGHEITAKNFCPWAGTVLAALALQAFEAVDSGAKAKKNVRAAIERVGSHLGNTPTICRMCCVHLEAVDACLSGSLLVETKEEVEAELRAGLSSLRPEEAAIFALLQRRLGEAGDSSATAP